MKILSVVGARPQFIKLAPVSRYLRQQHDEVLVHTGQHYDANMSAIFFQQLHIPPPNYNLGVGSGAHGHQTGKMLMRLEDVFQRESPDVALVYGDTNSTLAGALVAAKRHVPLVHIEAGLRSFNREMPEEINRVLTDHVSDLLCCPTETAVVNLEREGVTAGVHNTGDVMYDAVLYNSQLARAESDVLHRLRLRPRNFLLATVHRAENTDDLRRLRDIMKALNGIDESIVFPIHPRTRERLKHLDLLLQRHIELIEPVGYLDMLALEMSARKILTDSGGVQKEAYFVATPCITLREETEWVETVDAGWNTLVGADKAAILAAVEAPCPTGQRPPYFGDGKAHVQVVDLLDSL
jgi:UDP-N-acetylglucosamine 2-epimerase